MAYHITREQMEKRFAYAMNDRQGEDELCISWIQNKKDFGWLNRQILNDQMKIWRKMAKEGILKIMEYNNSETEQNGMKLYNFIVQPYKNEEMEDCGFCPYALLTLGIMVSGYTYSFMKKENRDAIYNYVMKNITQPNENGTTEVKRENPKKRKLVIVE
jgi:hypothetical protein